LIPRQTLNLPEEWEPPLVLLVGMGMSKEDLSLLVLRTIQRAEILAGGERHLMAFADLRASRIELRSNLEGFLENIAEVSREKRTAVLASGDPLFYGIGSRLISVLGGDRVLVLPNITSVQALFARLGEPWENVQVASLHGRDQRTSTSRLLQVVGRHLRVAVFTDPRHTPGWIAQTLLNAGVTNRSMVVAEDLGLPSEKVGHFRLEEALDREFSSLNLVAVLAAEAGEVSGKGEKRAPVFGFPEEDFQHQGGLITKMEVRAVVLAHLQLCPGQVLWDLGAGSGSVSIEAARIASLGQVFAVEKHEARVKDLAANARRFGCFEVSPVHGSAIRVIDDLPDPDRVFIGGSGNDLEAILEKVALRLRPEGRVVQTAVTLDTLERARSFWMSRPFTMSITQLQISRSVPIGGSIRLDALNPVFVITAWRQGD